jgi:hypothetical protein
MTTKQELFTKIASEHLNIQTLEPRNRDRLDFYEVGVAGLQRALDAAYRAGQAELLAVAEALLAAKDNQMETVNEWRNLRRAIRHAKKQNALLRP